MPKKKTTVKKLQVRLVRSTIGYSERQKATIRALGLRRLNQTVVHVDTPALRGMLAKVNHLIEIKEQVEE